MPSTLFATLAQQATAAVDAVTAEAWQLQPRVAAADKTAAAVVDTSRAAVTFLATFLDPEAKPELPNSFDRRQVRRPGEVSSHPRLVVSPAQIAAQSLVIAQSDLLVRQADGVTWRVASALAMAGGTLKLDLNIVG